MYSARGYRGLMDTKSETPPQEAQKQPPKYYGVWWNFRTAADKGTAPESWERRHGRR